LSESAEQIVRDNALKAILALYTQTFHEPDHDEYTIAHAKKHVTTFLDPGTATPRWMLVAGDRIIVWVQE
jgi:hypothetical protein